MSGDKTADTTLEKIKVGSAHWKGVIPNEKHDWFVGRVQQAVKIYLSLVSPKSLRDELEGFERATRSPLAPIAQLASGLSAEAQNVLSRSGPLPKPPNGASANEAYYRDIRARLLRGKRWKVEGNKRRKDIKIVGPPRRRGRPSDAEIDVLVSFVSAAYAHAAAKPVTRSWSEEDESWIERIVEDCFANLNIDEAYSAKKAVQRHVKNRNKININC